MYKIFHIKKIDVKRKATNQRWILHKLLHRRTIHFQTQIHFKYENRSNIYFIIYDVILLNKSKHTGNKSGTHGLHGKPSMKMYLFYEQPIPTNFSNGNSKRWHSKNFIFADFTRFFIPFIGLHVACIHTSDRHHLRVHGGTAFVHFFFIARWSIVRVDCQAGWSNEKWHHLSSVMTAGKILLPFFFSFFFYFTRYNVLRIMDIASKMNFYWNNDAAVIFA